MLVIKIKCIVTCLLKPRIVKPEEQSLLGNGCVTRNNGVTVGSDMLYAVRADSCHARI
jgi:hypothetical protein